MAQAGRRSIARGMLIVPLVLVAVVASVSVAFADQVNGGHYSGLLDPAYGVYQPGITFKVSSDGSKVQKMKVDNPPNFCGYGGPNPPVQEKAKAVPISGTGTFSETLRWNSNGSLSATLEITGKFRGNGRETGKATVTWEGSSQCDGTVKYSTTSN